MTTQIQHIYIQRKTSIHLHEHIGMARTIDRLLIAKEIPGEISGTDRLDPLTITYPGKLWQKSFINPIETIHRDEREENYSVFIAFNKNRAEQLGHSAYVLTHTKNDSQSIVHPSISLIDYVHKKNPDEAISMVINLEQEQMTSIIDSTVLFKEDPKVKGSFECVFAGKNGAKILQEELLNEGRIKELEVLHKYMEGNPEHKREIIPFDNSAAKKK